MYSDGFNAIYTYFLTYDMSMLNFKSNVMDLTFKLFMQTSFEKLGEGEGGGEIALSLKLYISHAWLVNRISHKP